MHDADVLWCTLSSTWTLTVFEPMLDVSNGVVPVAGPSRPLPVSDADHPIDWVAVKVEHLRQLRLAAVLGFPQNLADYLCDRLLDMSDLKPGYDEPLKAYLFGGQ